MNNHDKTKKELICELHELQLKHNSLRELYDADRNEHQQVLDSLEKIGSLAKIGAWEYNPQDLQFSWSTEVYKIFEITDAVELNLDRVLKLYPDESSGIILRAVNLAIEKGKSFVWDSDIITASGNCKRIRTQGEVVQNERSKSKHLFGTIQDISEMLLIDRVRQESELTLNQIEQITHIGHWSVNIINGSFFHSDETKRIFGYEPSEYALSVEEAINAYHPDDRDEVIRFFNRATETGEDYEFDLRVIQPNGKIRNVHSVGYTEQNEDGKVIRVYGVFQDITERKQSEEKLKETNALLRIAGEKAKLGGWSINLEENRVVWSDEIAAIHEMPAGYSPLLEDALDFYAPECREKITNHFTACAQNGTPYDEELEIITSNKKRVWVKAIGEAIRNSEGKIITVQGAFQDITERKQAEETLRIKNEELDRYFSLSLDLLCIANTDGYFIRLNPAWEMVLGYSIAELQGRSFLELVHPDDIANTLAALSDLSDKKPVLQFENRYCCKDGSYRCIEWQSQPYGELIYAVARDITERKHAEEAMRESEQRYRGLISNLNSGVVVHAPDTSITLSNQRAAELLGLSEEQMRGKVAIDPRWNFIDEHNNTIPLNEYPVMRVLSIRKAIVNQVLGVHRPETNDVVWLMVNGIPVNNNKGELLEIIISFMDITERKHAEEALRESENRFRALFEKGPIGVAYHEMVYDDSGKAIDYRFLDANSSYIELTGVDPRGKLVTQAFPGIENDPFDWIGTFGHVASTGEQIRFEQYLQPNNRWYDCVGYQFKQDHFVAAFMEITERKQAEELLKKSEERFRKLFNEAPLGMVVIDSLTGEINDLNPMFAKIAGRTMAEMKDINWMSITHPDDIQADLDNMDRMNAGKTKGFTMEKRYLHKDGSPVWINLTVAPLNVEDKTHPRHLCMIEDITERKQSKELMIANKELVFQSEEKEKRAAELIIANKELAFQNEEKEKRAAELLIANKELLFQSEEKEKRAAELIIANNELAYQNEEKEKRAAELLIANKELVFQSEEKEKRAAELIIANNELAFQNEEKGRRASELVVANKELESFSYSVSHDLRAPLRHIDGYVELLISRYYDMLPDKARHYLDNIADSSRQMGTLIDDLLQFSRTGRQALRLAHVDMNSIVAFVLEQIQHDVPDRNIEWNIAQLPFVLADEALLRLVWTNLLSNAVKFTRNCEKAIIEIDVLDEDNTFTFSVRDNGVGFDMQYAQNLFGVFQRLHPNDQFEGTGIGLANVHQIIIKHGGRTWAESVPNKGATFFFSLPK